ncbi:hypothetical protein N8T08_007638 [Aspergillus melleus]|uniref:Uncharacterized protein n=1 Tax=Aspergillus melleus TaxID=138277 RepID=A0ACC3BEE1_9EURO|nr:hypothetical protein N8T08_007638 [Aspergillus melleus]
MGRGKVNLPPSGGADSEIGTEDGERPDYAPIRSGMWTATVNHYMLFFLRIQKQKTIDYTPWDPTIDYPVPNSKTDGSDLLYADEDCFSPADKINLMAYRRPSLPSLYECQTVSHTIVMAKLANEMA